MNTAVQQPVPQIPDYELVRLIGSGSYGDVWLARGVTGVFRAVKIVWRARFNDPRPYAREFEGITRFAEISLREPSQLALLHAGRNDEAGFFYYVMELADDADRGRDIEPASYVPLTLKEVRDRRDHLPVAEVVALGAALARALASLHATGLVHRDIKPSNIVLVGGVPKLADVGLVAAASEGLTFVGTEGFVPPEGPGAPAADVFSLGKVLYELATGHDRQDFPRLPANLAEWPDRRALLELNEVLLRACEPMAMNRFANAGALLDELLLLQAGKSVRRLRNAERRTARALRIAAVLALVAAVAGAGAWFERQRRREAEAERDELARRTVYGALLMQAERMLDADNFGRARQLLAEAAPKPPEPDLRGIEWRALRSQATGDTSEALRPEGGPVIDKLALSPDRTLLAVHDEGGNVTLFETATRREIRRLAGVRRLAGFSTDGRWLVGTTPDVALQRWPTAGGAAPAPPHGGSRFRPLGTLGSDQVLAFVDGPPATLVVWDFATQRETRVDLGESGDNPPWEFFRAALDERQRQLAIACVRGRGSAVTFRLTVIDLGENLALEHVSCALRPTALAWMPGPDGGSECWAVEDFSGRVLKWSRAGRAWTESELRLPKNTALVVPSAPTSSDSWLVAHEAMITAFAAGSPPSAQRKLRGHDGEITGLVGPIGQFVFSSSRAGELRAWPLAAPTEEKKSDAVIALGNLSRVAISADGQRVYASDASGGVAVLDAGNQAQREIIPGMCTPFATLGDQVWGFAADAKSVVRWSSTERALRTGWAAGPSPILHAALSRDGRRGCVSRVTGELTVFDCDAVTPPFVVAGAFQNVWALQMNQTGSRLWCASLDQNLLALDLPSGRVAWKSPLPAVVADLRWLAGTDTLAVLLSNGTVQLHDAATGAQRRTFPAGTATPSSLAVTRANQRLLVGDKSGSIHVFAAPDWMYLGAIRSGSGDPLLWLNVAADDSAMVAISPTGRVQLIGSR